AFDAPSHGVAVQRNGARVRAQAHVRGARDRSAQRSVQSLARADLVHSRRERGARQIPRLVAPAAPRGAVVLEWSETADALCSRIVRAQLLERERPATVFAAGPALEVRRIERRVLRRGAAGNGRVPEVYG